MRPFHAMGAAGIGQNWHRREVFGSVRLAHMRRLLVAC